MLKVVKQKEYARKKLVPEAHKRDRENHVEAVKQNNSATDNAAIEPKADRKLVLEAEKQNGYAQKIEAPKAQDGP